MSDNKVNYSRSFADFIKEVDEFVKAFGYFSNLTESGKYAFVCTTIEDIANETEKRWEEVFSRIAHDMEQMKR